MHQATGSDDQKRKEVPQVRKEFSSLALGGSQISLVLLASLTETGKIRTYRSHPE
jgi:hypothetical protein